jgi:hypothetical protein
VAARNSAPAEVDSMSAITTSMIAGGIRMPSTTSQRPAA